MPEIVKIKYHKQFKIPAVDASGKYEIPIPPGDVNTHNFFNDLSVINTSANDLEFTPDHDDARAFFVPAKSKIGWSFKDDNMRFSSLTLEEKSAAALTENLVQVIVIKKRIEVTDNA